MKNIKILAIITLILFLTGCTDPFTAYQQMKAEDKIKEAFTNASEASQLKMSADVKMTLESETESSEVHFQYDGRIDKENSGADLDIILDSQSEDPSSIPFNLKAKIITEKDAGVYIEPEFDQDGNYQNVLSGYQSLYLNQESLNEIAAASGQEITEEEKTEAQNMALDIQDELSEMLLSMSKDMDVTNIDDNTYTVEISKENFIKHFSKFYDNVDGIFDTSSFDEFRDSEEMEEGVDMDEMVKDMDETLETDPIKMEIILSEDEKEIEKATTNLEMLSPEEDSLIINLEFSMTDFNENINIEIPDNENSLTLDIITTEIEKGTPANLINPAFLEIIGIPADQINQMAPFVSAALTGDISSINLNGLLEMLGEENGEIPAVDPDDDINQLLEDAGIDPTNINIQDLLNQAAEE